MTSKGETIKTKVIDPEKLYNFVVNDILCEFVYIPKHTI